MSLKDLLNSGHQEAVEKGEDPKKMIREEIINLKTDVDTAKRKVMIATKKGFSVSEIEAIKEQAEKDIAEFSARIAVLEQMLTE